MKKKILLIMGVLAGVVIVVLLSLIIYTDNQIKIAQENLTQNQIALEEIRIRKSDLLEKIEIVKEKIIEANIQNEKNEELIKEKQEYLNSLLEEKEKLIQKDIEVKQRLEEAIKRNEELNQELSELDD